MVWYSSQSEAIMRMPELLVANVVTAMNTLQVCAHRYRFRHEIDQSYEIKSNETLQEYLIDLEK